MEKSTKSRRISPSTLSGDVGDEVPLWDMWLNGDISLEQLPENEKQWALKMLDKNRKGAK
jgi:hypothetical protein